MLGGNLTNSTPSNIWQNMLTEVLVKERDIFILHSNAERYQWLKIQDYNFFTMDVQIGIKRCQDVYLDSLREREGYLMY